MKTHAISENKKKNEEEKVNLQIPQGFICNSIIANEQRTDKENLEKTKDLPEEPKEGSELCDGQRSLMQSEGLCRILIQVMVDFPK